MFGTVWFDDFKGFWTVIVQYHGMIWARKKWILYESLRKKIVGVGGSGLAGFISKAYTQRSLPSPGIR